MLAAKIPTVIAQWCVPVTTNTAGNKKYSTDITKRQKQNKAKKKHTHTKKKKKNRRKQNQARHPPRQDAHDMLTRTRQKRKKEETKNKKTEKKEKKTETQHNRILRSSRGRAVLVIAA